MKTQQELSVQLALDQWNNQIKRATKLFEDLTDDQLAGEVAPGRNTGVYLLGHLAAVHDGMLPLLNFGERLHPELENIFLTNPDKSALEKPAISTLRKYWKEVDTALSSHFSKLTVDEWYQKHSAISEEDFKKEPNRNRLNVLLNRTGHVAYHLGQLAFLKK